MDLRETLLIVPGILLGFSFHEYAHAQVAVWLGDDTPKDHGRLSLSPSVHIDIWGFILILIAGFGWAKPVPINESNFKNPRRDDILVSLAGPVMNLLIALFFLTLMKVMTITIDVSTLDENTIFSTIMQVFNSTVWINVVLFVFNLLPIPPLDGSHIFFSALNLKHTDFYQKFYFYSRFLLPILIITDSLSKIMGPPIFMVYRILMGIFF